MNDLESGLVVYQGSINEEYMFEHTSNLLFMIFQKEFAFLVDDYGFNGPYFKQLPLLYTVWYKAERIAVEHSLDWKDQAIDFYISKVINKTIPSEYLFNDQGERIRLRYLNWLIDKGIKDLQYPKLKGLSFNDQIPIEIHHNAYLFRKYGQIFLEDKLDAFGNR